LIPFATFDDIPEASASLGNGGDNDKQEKPFLWCPYNQHETAFRSPWTQFYYSVETNNGVEDIRIYERECPEEEQFVRDLEGAANEVWSSYVHLYYGKEAIGSVYLKPSESSNGGAGSSSSSSFEGLFGVQKSAAGNGSWDSVHLIKVDEPNEQTKTCEYHVESAVSMSLTLGNDKSDISASLTKDTTKTLPIRYSGVLASHLENIGKMIEDVEIDFRSKLERVHLPSTIEVIPSIYRKQHGPSGTAHLMTVGGNDNESIATGMGVGAGMIGEIASKAKAKAGGSGGANPFMEAMKANLAAKKVAENTNDTGDQYNDLKSGLKKRPSTTTTTTTGLDLKKTLKPPGQGQQQQYNSSKSTTIPSPSMVDVKKTLKKTTVSTKPPSMESAPTPEFMDFRNKLRKSGIKP
jgi:capping protein beta